MSSNVSGITNEAYVSNVDFLHNRDVYHKIYNRYHEDTILDFFEQTGREKVTDQTAYHWFEKDWVYNTVTVASVTGGASPGAALTVTISAGDHQLSGTRSPFVVGDILMIRDTERALIQSKNETTPNAHTFTITPLNSALQLDTVVAGTDVLVNITNAHGEGTTQPESQINSPLRFENQVQIFKNTYEVTGSEATNKLEVEVTNSNKRYYMFEGADDTFMKHKLDIEYGLLLGTRGDDTALDANGERVRTTQGMDSLIAQHGHTQNYTTDFDQMSYIDDIVKTLSVERAPLENMMLNGVNLDISVDNLLTDVMKSGALVYNSFGSGNGSQRSIDLGFDSFRKGTFVFHKKRFDALNHPKITSSTSTSPWPGVGYVIPLDKVRDPMTNKQMDTICLRYKANSTENRKYKHWYRNVEITNKDSLEFNYLCEKGLQMATLNRFVKIQQA